MNSTMDHALAESTNAVERYLLEETTIEERALFEEHLFNCAICAEEVRTGAFFFDNAKQVFRTEPALSRKPGGFFLWLRGLSLQPPMLIPAAALFSLVGIVGYQNLVTIPGLLRPQILATTVIAPLSREAGPVIGVDRKLPMFNLNFSVDSPRAYPVYTCTFESAEGKKLLTINTEAKEVSSFTLSVLLPVSKFPAGSYVVNVTPSSEPQTSAGRYTFSVRDAESRHRQSNGETH